ncbi:membrane dipeptidase-domain-containing protein [Cantharellus anzutake]|uniref:membrane dipeptidase-domain-containing protein n=1 Tax=Cantharellus anzutake TaxID=1750568 RepID=UPI0019064EB5|nr:membrane dipeptidase-domain-containing protein [Cantharellus anzutake]KAF8332091.1 membrane dipeptidase-domain-containing protein [Cantharellus anzutake]
MPDDAESQPLLGSTANNQEKRCQTASRMKILRVIVFLAIVVAAFVFAVVNKHEYRLPDDPLEAALEILGRHPLMDSHIGNLAALVGNHNTEIFMSIADLPELARVYRRNNVSDIDLAKLMPGHVDIPRLRKGRVGGFFWSVYTACPSDPGDEFTYPTAAVRDTLEQIDVAKGLIEKHPDVFQFATSSSDIRKAFSQGKMASLIGVEGGHQLENSLAALRQYYALGVRYVTLTHTCHNAFADSGGFFEPIPPRHNGLSSFGKVLIQEMNRLGILVDISHTSDQTAVQALKLSRSPVIWSHSSARSVWNVSRNVPDEILELIGEGPGKRDAVIQVNFFPGFVAADGKATVAAVADHIEHIARKAGRQHVGIGSDFDGISSVPKGLEDVSKYPNLFAELYKRGWTEKDLAGLASENVIRIIEGAERTAKYLQSLGMKPRYDIYDKRNDL